MVSLVLLVCLVLEIQDSCAPSTQCAIACDFELVKIRIVQRVRKYFMGEDRRASQRTKFKYYALVALNMALLEMQGLFTTSLKVLTGVLY